ncbi:TIGR01777 family oxidoreductase [Georgenia sunbinii]|uniref:TIGR01777 family oxidoreductase n=1 Tax=Georgenia sunbinii TaxID=3117728 RepID=UPI002F26555D
MKVLIAGASGLIGTAVQHALRDAGHQVRTLVRRVPRNVAEYEWQPDEGRLPAEAIEWADGVVSLSGAALGRLPWTAAYRRTLYRSRVDPTRTIATALAVAADPPTVWVSGSAVGYYGDRPDEVLTDDAAAGEGFLAELVTRWEAATAAAPASTRVVHARTGIVLAQGGALQPLFLATRLGAGARVGTGRQHWPWISRTDEARGIVHLLTESSLDGAVNLASPRPATAEDITRALAAGMGRPHLLRLPAPLLTLVMGEPAEELLLADQQVHPQRLLDDGFTFQQPDLGDAVGTALAR